MVYISHFKQESPPPVRIEFTVDSCVHNPQTYMLVEQTAAFFEEVKARTGWDIQVAYREPAQIFHEKNRYLTPEQAPADVSVWAGNQREYIERVRDGRYRVDPPGAIEARYKQALQRAVFEAAQEENPGFLSGKGIGKAEEIGDDLLQSLQLSLRAFNDRHSRGRRLEGFKAYVEERADAGERSMADFIARRPEPQGADKVISLFVSTDHGALERVRAAGRNAPGVNTGKVQVHALHRNDFRSVLRNLIRDVKREHPLTADIPSPVLSQGISGFVARTGLDPKGWGQAR